MLKPTIFKVLWFALIFIQKYFSKTPIHLADEMPTSEGVRQGTSSQLVSLFFTLVKSLYMLPGERTEEMKKIRKTTIASVDALYNVHLLMRSTMSSFQGISSPTPGTGRYRLRKVSRT